MIERLDHFVLTVADIQRSVSFYTEVLGMKEIDFAGRKALSYVGGKINLHEVGKEFEPKARHPKAGSADLCFITLEPLSKVAVIYVRKALSHRGSGERHWKSLPPPLPLYS
ncbi:VOC family protein [Wolinella succinogenes]|uniref:VOC family protein n=1 Tax=Wolinella succinogenes TaxID=844 RepID=UPI001E600E48|nr:VOC family protein [Wolinella succinogenes]